MRPPLTRIVVVVAALALLPLQASSWNKPGHMVTGAIAYHELKQSSPETIRQVVLLLEQHPFYKTMWKPRIDQLRLRGDARDRFLFIFAARWPDDARDSPQFHHAFWHFVNFPFKPPNQPSSVHTHEPEAENVVAAFNLNLGVLRNPRATRPEKAVALCWIFHLVGDVHQPLHTTALFSTVFPNGDRGGNLWFVRNGSEVKNLHSFWDGLILGSEDLQKVSERADQLQGLPELARPNLAELSEKSFERWAKVESFAAAVEFGYLRGQLPASSNERRPVPLSRNYVNSAQRVAQRRNILAGYRLADLLPALANQH
ncbi:MAG: S1/P1 nuclease [Acidobacteriota bacterium]